jgi:hypothetical protein
MAGQETCPTFALPHSRRQAGRTVGHGHGRSGDLPHFRALTLTAGDRAHRRTRPWLVRRPDTLWRFHTPGGRPGASSDTAMAGQETCPTFALSHSRRETGRIVGHGHGRSGDLTHFRALTLTSGDRAHRRTRPWLVRRPAPLLRSHTHGGRPGASPDTVMAGQGTCPTFALRHDRQRDRLADGLPSHRRS